MSALDAAAAWGGRIVWLYAAHSPQLKAGAAWYGRLVGGHDALDPKNPVDGAGALRAPVLGLYGGQDQGLPRDTIGRKRAALRAAGCPSGIVVYPDAGHAFHADYRPSYQRAAAEDGWKRMLEWFTRYGAAWGAVLISLRARACCARRPQPAWRRPPDSRMRTAAFYWEPCAGYSVARPCPRSARPP